MRIYDVRCCGLADPVGIGEKTLSFSWKIESEEKNTVQSAYRLCILDSKEDVVWDSGWVTSAQQQVYACASDDLASNTEYRCYLQVEDNHGNRARNGEASFTTSIREYEWKAKWIGCQSSDLDQGIRMATKQDMVAAFLNMVNGGEAGVKPDRQLDACNLYRKDFAIEHRPAKAYLSITAHGLYEARINGKAVTDTRMNPGFTAYEKYLEFQTYDVTELLGQGGNVFTVILADGWYKGKFGILGYGNNYGLELSLLAQIELQYPDGRREWIVTDGSCRYRKSACLYSDLLIGEKQDGRIDMEAMYAPDCGTDGWKQAEEKQFGYGNLYGICCEPVRCTQVLEAENILVIPRGELVVDMGQNMVGYLRLSVSGPEGREIKLEYSEVLDREGNFLKNISGVNRDQTDYYITGGTGEEVFEPKFTFHGFRYVKITGYPGTLQKEHVQGIVLGSDLERGGVFRCSDPALDKLQSNICWSQRGNMLSIPTDCPQRERAGWTGDVLVYAKTAIFNQNVKQFLRKWLRNMEKEQFENGLVPVVVPYPLGYSAMQKDAFGSDTSAGWGDAAVTVPWDLYQAYGDMEILKECFDMMKKWMDYAEQEAARSDPEQIKDMHGERRERQRYLWNTGFHYGDWLYPSCTNDKGETDMFRSAYTTKEYADTCMLANSADIMRQVCICLGNLTLARHYGNLHEKIRAAFAEEYVSQEGEIAGAVQGIYVLAIAMKMGDEKKLQGMARRLADMIRENGYRLDTGFMSVPYLLDVLCQYGYEDIARKVLYQDQCPSWLYEVKNGATTMWETWNAVLEDGTRTDNSYNHYAFGCVGDWMYRNLLGIRRLAEGYRQVEISPQFLYGLRHARGCYESIYGTITCEWQLDGSEGFLCVGIPVGVQAQIRLPGIRETVGSGHYEYRFTTERRRYEE